MVLNTYVHCLLFQSNHFAGLKGWKLAIFSQLKARSFGPRHPEAGFVATGEVRQGQLPVRLGLAEPFGQPSLALWSNGLVGLWYVCANMYCIHITLRYISSHILLNMFTCMKHVWSHHVCYTSLWSPSWSLKINWDISTSNPRGVALHIPNYRFIQNIIILR